MNVGNVLGDSVVKEKSLGVAAQTKQAILP